MSLEWVGTVCTAAVGLAGIAATWLTARANRIDQRNLLLAQQRHAAEMALKETRRKTYGQFLSNVYRMTDASIAAIHTEEPDLVEARDIASDIYQTLAEVRIIGSKEVRALASQVSAGVLRHHAAVLEENASNESVDEEIENNLRKKQSQLERLMATDLGIPSHLPDDTSK
jgi:hypothetical protein